MIHVITLAKNSTDDVGLKENITHWTEVCSTMLKVNGVTIFNAKSIASGYNEGVSAAIIQNGSIESSDILCFVHTDVRFHFPLERIEEFFALSPAVIQNIGVVGFVGARHLSLDGRWWLDNERCGSLIQGAGDKPNLNFDAVDTYEPVDSVDGFCMFIKYGVFRRIGGFDIRYPGWHYYDADLCMMAKVAGYQNYVINHVAQHFSGGSLDEGWEHNQKLFQEKWKGVLV